MATASPQVTVVVGVDGAGRSHRLGRLAADRAAVRIAPGDNVDTVLSMATAAGHLVLVDDAHRLEPAILVALTAAARQGAAIVVARRPTIASRELAELDEVLAARGQVELLQPLDHAAMAELVGTSGRPVDELLHASGGLPAVAAALLAAPPGAPPPALVARVQRRLAMLDPAVAGLARLLALRLELPDTVLSAASTMDRSALAAGMRALRDEGLLVPGSELMVPAVAEALLADLPAAERRRVHEAVARALIDAGTDVVAAATQLRAARAFIPAAASVYAQVGDRLRFSAPAAALTWYDDALEAGADPSVVTAGRAEAAALVGLNLENPTVDSGQKADPRLTLVDGAVAAHHGRSDRAAQALGNAPPPGPLLAVPALVSIGRLGEARSAAAGPGPAGVSRLAEAALAAAAEPAAAVPLLIEAAEALEQAPPALVLPDTAHALGALVASVAGDAASAEYLLLRALEQGIGGPVGAQRHQLVLAWVRLRAGRYDTAVIELGRLSDAALPGRERFLLAACSAGIARRSGDIARLRDAWAAVEPVLARRAVDLFAVEAVEELAVAATRLRRYARVAPVLETLDTIVDGLGRPPAWQVAVGWIRLQVAIADEDPAAAAEAAQRIAVACQSVAGARQRAQCAAATLWVRILGGDVDPDASIAVAEQLAAVELPWEGSRLVGQAAIRTGDAAAARRLLERARDLSSAEVAAVDKRPGGAGPSQSHGSLSEREVEVARMVLAGDTYREIGARLFISPKTVEHHVARIRTKLGATSRAEFVAALRSVLGPEQGG